MPESLWKIFWFNRDLLNVISGVAAGIIQEIARKKNAVTGIFTALHTFGRDLKRNVHIHLSVTCGGLNDKNAWVNLFFPEAPIKKMWRHRIIELFRNEYENQKGLVLNFCFSDSHIPIHIPATNLVRYTFLQPRSG